MTANGRRVTVSDLLDADLLEPDEEVEFVRPRLGEHYTARIQADGSFILPDQSIYQSPSVAAIRAANVASYDGWLAWRVIRLGGTRLDELRRQYVAQSLSKLQAETSHSQA